MDNVSRDFLAAYKSLFLIIKNLGLSTKKKKPINSKPKRGIKTSKTK